MVDLITLISDLKENIFMLLPCKSIFALLITCKDLNTFITNNNLISKRKNVGFPRKSGYCEVHKAVQDSNDVEYDYYTDIISSSILTSILYQNNEFIQYITDKFTNKEYDKRYKIIYDSNIVRGDLLYVQTNEYCYNIYIYDGCKIIELDKSIDKYGMLPKEFTVITSGIPANYWYNESYVHGGINTNSFIWFNITEDIRIELINNIKDDGLSTFKEYLPTSDKLHYTNFTFNGKTYYIIDSFDNINIFTNVLSSKEQILLEYNNYDILSNRKKISTEIIFLSGYYNNGHYDMNYFGDYTGNINPDIENILLEEIGF
jgi:hypothetical protein